MDPLTPTTSTLSPAVAHIVETAKALAGALQDSDGNAKEKPRVENNEAATLKEAQQDTVRWVLATPMRLRSLLDDGKREEADNDWVEIKGLLEGWHGVAGVQDLRNQCSMIMAGKTSDSNT